MCKIISVANQKGGTAKTTTAINLAAGLSLKKFKTLLLDLDPQGNSTSGVGQNKNELNKHIYHCLIGEETIDNVIKSTDFENLYVCPSNSKLASAEAELLMKIGRENTLKKSISETTSKFDYIIIDCPPSLGVLSVNALMASDSAIIPVEASEFSMEGMHEFLTTFQLVKNVNTKLEIEGILITRAESNTNSYKKCYEQLQNVFGDKCYKFSIPRNQAIADSQFSGNFEDSKAKPCVICNPNAKGSLRYMELVNEVTNHG